MKKYIFPKLYQVPGGGVYSTTFDTKLRNEVKKFPILGGYIQQPVILQSEMHLKNFQTVTTCFTAKSINIELFLPVSLPRNIQNYSQNQ